MKQISDKSPLAGLLLLVVICCYLFFTLIAHLISPQINAHAGLSFNADMLAQANEWQRQCLRLSLMLNNFFSYTATALLALFLCHRQQWLSVLTYAKPKPKASKITALLLFLCALPLVIYTAWLNLQIPLPDWAVQDEAYINMILGTVLKMESPAEFIIAFTTMAITPAIGEELLYRGVIQKNIFGGFSLNRHLSIWLAAAIFSAAHFEFAGFFPRLLLGAVFGYSYYWTRSIWTPIILHLFFNGGQVISTYINGEYQADTEMAFAPGWWVGVLGLVATVAVWWFEEQQDKQVGAAAGSRSRS